MVETNNQIQLWPKISAIYIYINYKSVVTKIYGMITPFLTI